MPTYEYACKKCGENFDIHQSFSEKPLKKHKDCGGDLQKVFHARGIVFKGGGFYATDSKPSRSQEKPKSDTKSDSKKKSDTKPKAKAKTSSSKSSSKDS